MNFKSKYNEFCVLQSARWKSTEFIMDKKAIIWMKYDHLMKIKINGPNGKCFDIGSIGLDRLTNQLQCNKPTDGHDF